VFRPGGLSGNGGYLSNDSVVSGLVFACVWPVDWMEISLDGSVPRLFKYVWFYPNATSVTIYQNFGRLRSWMVVTVSVWKPTMRDLLSCLIRCVGSSGTVLPNSQEIPQFR